jgi:hypothetical protein
MKGGGNYGNEESSKKARSSKAQGREEGSKAQGSKKVSRISIKNSPAS